MAPLNRKQRTLRWVKKHKKKTVRHTAVASVLAILLIFSLHWTRLDLASPAEEEWADRTDRLSVLAVGDVMLGRYIEEHASHKGYGELFRFFRPLTAGSDIVTGNFSQPILTGDPNTYPIDDKYIHLKTEKEAAKAVKKAGFTTLSLANNHILDYGKPGLQETLRAFREQEIRTVGAGRDIYDAKKVVYQEVNGKRVATLGYNDRSSERYRAGENRPGVAPADPKLFLGMVEKAKQNADFVIVHMHWGRGYDNGVHPRQRSIGHALADAGADLVIGHGPHVLEPVEIYKGTVILYSLGNFVSDQGWSRTKETVVAVWSGPKRVKEPWSSFPW